MSSTARSLGGVDRVALCLFYFIRLVGAGTLQAPCCSHSWVVVGTVDVGNPRVDVSNLQAPMFSRAAAQDHSTNPDIDLGRRYSYIPYLFRKHKITVMADLSLNKITVVLRPNVTQPFLDVVTKVTMAHP